MNTRQSSASSWTTRESVVVAVSSTVFGMLYLAWVQVWLVAQGLIGPIAMDIVFGFWFAGSTFNAYVIRKPGVAFATAMIAVVVQILSGNAAGAILLLTGLVQGAGSEIPFMLTRWKRYTWPVVVASAAAAAVMSFIYNWIRFDYGNLDGGLLIAMGAIRLTSGVVLGAIVPRLMADGLIRTGIFTGLALDTATTDGTD